MEILDRIRKDLKEYLTEERYNHTVRVEREALKLAQAWKMSDEDIEKVKLSSLLHDLGKSKKLEQLLKDRYGDYAELVDKLRGNGAIYHAHMGVELARCRYGIESSDILNSIRYHTTARMGMELVEKIVYLADYIEPGRSFDGLDKVRDLSYSDIDSAMIMALNQTIIHIVDRELILDEDTVKARNSLMEARSRGEGI